MKDFMIAPGSAKKIIHKAISRFTGCRGYAARLYVDEENEETMLIFYEPTEDYCVNVQITQHLHANEKKRKEAANGTSQILP
jgi:hypothetical protein